MRKFIAGFTAALAIALSALALSPQSASAQGFSITFGTGHPPMVRHFDDRQRYDPRPLHDYRRDHGYRHYDRRHHDRRAYRHAPHRRHAQDCTVRIERFWDGYRWISERRRICW